MLVLAPATTTGNKNDERGYTFRKNVSDGHAELRSRASHTPRAVAHPHSGIENSGRKNPAIIQSRRLHKRSTHMNIEEMLAAFPELSDEERDDVRAYVEAHPEWEPAFVEATRWGELLRAARSVEEHAPRDEAIAYYVATRDLRLDEAPQDVAETIRDIRDRIERDPELQKEVRRMAARSAEIEAAVPAGAHFERLTGHRLDSYPSVDDAAGGTVGYRSAPDRIGTASPLAWRIAASIVALVVTYGVLFAVGESLRPQYERLGSFEEDEVVIDGFGVNRSNSDDEVSASVSLYLDALEQLRRAETSFIGLFPSFDQSRLDSAAGMLRQVIANEPGESFLAGEAAYMLGKTELARGRIDAADEGFSRVVAAGGRRAADARRLQSEMEDLPSTED